MKYRVQVLVDNNRLPAVIEAAFTGALDYDPELKVWPATQPQMLPHDVAGIERPVKQLPVASGKRSGNNKGGNKRGELLEAALKTGPKRWSEMKTALSDGGLSESSLNNLIGIWKKAGKIARSEDGLWSLTDAEAQRANAG
jgi:hypothetical protein